MQKKSKFKGSLDTEVFSTLKCILESENEGI